MTLGSSVAVLPKVGPAVAAKLQKLGITTVRDLLFHWPRTWLDASTPVPIASVVQDQLVVLEGVLSNLQYQPPISKRRPKSTATLTDDFGDTVSVVWHNQSYLRRVLQNGQRWLLIGKIVWNWQSKSIELSNPQRVTERAVLAVYPETAGITSAFLRTVIASAVAQSVPDAVGAADPDQQIPSLISAIQTMHRPTQLVDVIQAKQRLALDELVMLQYRLHQQRTASRRSAPPIVPAVGRLQEVVEHLPFKLTTEQRRVSWAIIKQLDDSEPLRHILQGDVGTGKTVVAFLVAVSVLEAGHDVCWMAPTQLLARQLSDRLMELCAGLPFDVALVTSADKPGASTRPTLYVGTQALLGFFVHRALPVLVIIDEQHRFGVKQQEELAAHACHLLTMTATPIPRALLLALYGDRGASQLLERPVQHAPVSTIALAQNQKEQAIESLAAAIARGEQGFIVTPRIEAGDDGVDTFPSLQAVLARYRRALPAVTFAPYHGKLTDSQQQQTMADFLSRKIDVLVTTSIIEVGLDVPSATQILIEQADWFGLAQLHQLRGRVGRGSRAGVCFVFHSSEDQPADRLQALCSTSNGFELAALDLRLRGPGDLLGALQSGWSRLRLADPTDTLLAQKARTLAGSLWQQSPACLGEWLALYDEGDVHAVVD